MGRFSEKHSKSMKSFSNCGNIAIQRQLTRKLNTASIHYFADCAKYVGCLALFGMMLCPIDVSANNVVANGKPAKAVVMKSIAGGSSAETNVTANDTIPFAQLIPNNSWVSTNHEDNSSSKKSWELICTKGDTLSFNYAVSSEENFDKLTVMLNDSVLLQVSGEKSDTFTHKIQKDGRNILTAIYSKDGSGNSGNDCGSITNISAGDLFTNLNNYLESLGEHAGLKQELSGIIQKLQAAPEDEAVIAELSATLHNVRRAFYCYPIIQQDLVVADSVLNDGAYVDIAEAVKLAKAINLATSRSNEYIAAFDALETSLAIQHSSTVDRSNWVFDTNTYKVIDDLCYNIDETNKLAQFLGLKESGMNIESLVVPATIRYNDETYAVVSLISNNRQQEIIKTISLPKTLRYLGSVSNYPNISEIIIPENVECIGDYIFNDNTKLSKIKVEAIVPPAANGQLDYHSRHYKITVPRESFHSYRLAAPWNESKSILIGGDEGVTVNVGTIAEGELGHFVIDNATYLEEVNKLVVAGSLNNEDWNTIQKMSNLVEIDLSGAYIETIPNSALYDRWGVDKVVLPESVKKIDNYAFYGSGIKEINLPDGLANIEGDAFRECYNLESVKIPAGVKAIPDLCFYGCRNLKNVYLSDSLLSIRSQAFQNCALTELVIPEQVSEISSYAFDSNKSLKKVTFNKNLVNIRECAFRGCAIDSIIFPTSLKYINWGAFRENPIESVSFNEGLISIGNGAFAECQQLKELVLPSSLEVCYSSSFNNCNGIKTVEARSIIPPSTNGGCPLSNVDLTKVVLYVPAWSVGEYQLADGWNSFYTFQASDFMPQNIKVNKNFYFSMPDELDSSYRPNIEMTWSNREAADSQGHTNYERGNLTVSSRSKLAINDFSMVISPFAKYYADWNIRNGYDWDDYRTYLNSTSLIVKGEMRAENTVVNLCNMRNVWQFVTFPFDVKVSDIVPQDENTSWVIRSHSGANRAAGKTDEVWQNLTADDVLEAGKGYIMHCYRPGNDEYVWFNVSPLTTSVNRQLIFNADSRTMPLEENLAEFDHNRSWNLIGNPYPSFYDTRFFEFDAPFMVWNSYAKNYYAYNPADDAYILSPGEAFFVQRPVEQESITFLKDGRQTDRYARTMMDEPSAPRRVKAANRSVYNITISNGDMGDRTRVVINDAASMAYEMSSDAAKFASTEATVPQIYTIESGTRYAINERPLSSGVVALGVHCGIEGEYTIALGGVANGTVILDDKEMGVSTEITADRGYTFFAPAGDYTSRFVLRFMPGTTAVDGVTVDETVENGDVYTIDGVKTTNDAAKQQKGLFIQNGKKVIKK